MAATTERLRSPLAQQTFAQAVLEALETRNRAEVLVPRRPMRSDLGSEDMALLALAGALRNVGYCFTCVTPDTHACVVARRQTRVHNLRDVFGWSLPFEQGDLPGEIMQLMHDANVLCEAGGQLKSLVRFSSFDQTLLAHSAWPTELNESVFFGPDTYRFASLIERAVQGQPSRPRTVIDVGCGTGAGGILAARLLGSGGAKVYFTDINETALRLARVNALHAGVADFSCLPSDVLAAVPDPVDLILANPPYLLDPQQRTYRHGGGSLGTGLSVRIVQEALDRLAPGGQLILYTASPFVDGIDTLREQLERVFDANSHRPFTFEYQEIDPDVFGSELEHPAYDEVERIAVVGLTLRLTESSNSVN